MRVKRCDKIAETWFATFFPLDKFRVKEGVLVFEDLSAAREPGPMRFYQVHWATYDQQGHFTAVPHAVGRHVPAFSGTVWRRPLAAALGPERPVPARSRCTYDARPHESKWSESTAR